MKQTPAQIAFECGRVQLSDTTNHPNKMTVTGVLVRLDEPSTKAPNGSDGHRILVPSSVAASRLKTLIGMGLNYAPDLEGHARRRKVGVITKAWIDGQDLCIKAHVWKHDFPEATRDLKQSGLGMSMEIGDVDVEDPGAAVWTLTDFCFLGATVLWKDAAAYRRTRAIAAAKAKENGMAATKKVTAKTPVVRGLTDTQLASIAAAAADGVVGKFTAALKQQNQILAGQAVAIDRLTLLLSEKDTPVLDEDEDESITAKGKDGEDDSDDDGEDDGDDKDGEDDCDDEDMESESEDIDKGDLEEMGPETGDDDEDDDTPGQLSKGAKNKGDKSSSEDKVGKTVSDGVTAARVNALIKSQRKMAARMAKVESDNAGLRKQLRASRKQIAASADRQDRLSRRYVDPELAGLMAKGGVSVSDLEASGRKLTVEQFDGLLNSIDGLDSEKRMQLKSEAARQGVMEEGHVYRGRR